MIMLQISEGSKHAMLGVEDFYHRVIDQNELAWEHIAEASCKDTKKWLA